MINITELMELFKKHNPNPKVELDSINDFTFAVAVILSAQATDKGVNKATPKLFKVADTPAKMVKLGEFGLKPLISSIGLYKNKAKNIIAMSKELLEKHNGELPHTKEELVALPGIGAKTASVIMNTLWEAPEIAVDTHVFRTSHRLKIVPERANNPDKVSAALKEVIPSEYHHNAANWLVLHGRYICKAQKPNCLGCFLKNICPYPDKNL